VSRHEQSSAGRPTELRLVYILGTGRSASTLLDVALGSHSAMLSLGEVMGAVEATESNPLCADGEPFLECPFWTPVRDTLAVASVEQRKYFNGVRFPRLLALYAPRRYRRVVAVFSELNLAALGGFQCTTPEATWIDASKMYWRLHFLRRAVGDGTIRVIYLYRDGEAVINSEMSHGSSFVRALAKWWLHNYGALREIRTLASHNYQVLRFDELLGNPERVLRGLSSWLDVEFEPLMLNPHWNRHYGFSGNRHVLSALRRPRGVVFGAPTDGPNLTWLRHITFRVVTFRLRRALARLSESS